MPQATITPINSLRQPSDEAAIDAAINSALSNGLAHVQRASDWAGSVKGKTILEIGPGPNFASALTMIAFGAKRPVTIVDPWIAPWDPDYHPVVYRGVAERLAADHPGVDLSVFGEVIAAGRHDSKILELIETSAEDLSALKGRQFDVLVSNAVLEHVPDMEKAAAEMFAVTAPGGRGLHAVDLRNHGDFANPLDYLLMSEAEAAEWAEETEFHLGSLRRKRDYDRVFERAKFKIIQDYVTVRAEEDYFAEFVKRLRRASEAEYRDYPQADLDVLGVFYVLER
jgi:SAM-dependent methyltransferase